MLFEHNTLYLVFKLLITTLGTFAITSTMLRFRVSRKKKLLSFAVYLACSMSLSLLIIHFGGYMLFSWYFLFTTTLPGLVMFFLIVDAPPMQTVFICVSHILISLYVAAGVTLFNSYLHGNELSDLALRLAAYFILILLETFLLRRPFLLVADTVSGGWGVLSLLPSTLTVLGVAFGQYPENYIISHSGRLRILFLGIVTLSIYFAILQYLWIQYQYQMRERDREILGLQIQNIRKNAADTKRKAEIAKRARQDTLTLMGDIASLAKDGDLKAILAILEKEKVKNIPAAFGDYCSDPVLNAVLSSYLGRARNSGITLETHLSIPKMLSTDCTEFGICLANALENAIRACEKLPRSERRMTVKCIGSPRLMFRVENTYKGKITFTRDGLPKASATGHGTGTRSIMAFCGKYNALYSFKAKNGWFSVTVAL